MKKKKKIKVFVLIIDENFFVFNNFMKSLNNSRVMFSSIKFRSKRSVL